MPHFNTSPLLERSPAGTVFDSFKPNPFTQHRLFHWPPSTPHERNMSGQVISGDHDFGRKSALTPKRRESWLDQVETSTTKRGCSTSSSLPRLSAGSSDTSRSSPSELRPTAPEFQVSFQYPTESAIEEVDYAMSSLAKTSIAADEPWALDQTCGVHDRHHRLSDESACESSLGFTFPSWHPGAIGPPKRNVTGGSDREKTPASSGLPENASQPARHNVFPKDIFLDIYEKTQGAGPNMRLSDFATQPGGFGYHNSEFKYAIIEFKLYRMEIYEMPVGWGLCEDQQQPWTVIVEADRGFDLGKVHKLTPSLEIARTVQKDYVCKHWHELIKASRSLKWQTMSPEESMPLFEEYWIHMLKCPGEKGPWPRSVVAHASIHDQLRLPEKQAMELRAKADCQHQISAMGSPLEVVGVEFQLDQQRLTLYYISEEYIDYGNITAELYKEYKCRLWFVALNPRSFTASAKSVDLTNRPGQWPVGAYGNMPGRGATAKNIAFAHEAQNYFASNNFGRYNGNAYSTRTHSMGNKRQPWNQCNDTGFSTGMVYGHQKPLASGGGYY